MENNAETGSTMEDIVKTKTVNQPVAPTTPTERLARLFPRGASQLFPQGLLTAKEAIHTAHLDWKVEQHPLYYQNEKTKKYCPVIGRFSVTNVNATTGQSLGCVSSRYQVVQNEEAFGFFDEVTKTKEAIYTGAGTLDMGRIVWMMAKLPNDMLIFKNDVVEKQLCLMTSHDGSFPLLVFFTPRRISCANQLPAILRASKRRGSNAVTLRHTRNILGRVKEARSTLGLALEFFTEFETQAKRMATTPLGAKRLDQFLDKTLRISSDDKAEEKSTSQKDHVREEIVRVLNTSLSLVASRGTVWGAYNAVTEWVDHYASSRNADEDPTARLKSLWMGAGQRMKLRAFDQAMEFVQVR